MKTELEYLKIALATYIKRVGKWNASVPLTSIEILDVLTIADELHAADKKAMETS
jgi:hypothetical protein